MGRKEPGGFQSPSQGKNNLHTFAIEKKAQRERRMFNLKDNIESYIF
jgi:hypothetical protein